LKPVVDHVDADHPVPTDRRIVIEGSARTVAVNAAFGHEVNETLARLLAALVGQRAGSSIGMDVDPYRIEFEVCLTASVPAPSARCWRRPTPTGWRRTSNSP